MISPVGRRSRGAARLVQQHERQQADDFRFGKQFDQQSAQANRFARKIGTSKRLAG